MGKVVSVTNSKGGVGKSTISAHLGFFLQEQGHNVLVIDQEYPCSISYILDQKHPTTGSCGIKMFSQSKYTPQIHKCPNGISLLMPGGDLNSVESFGWDAIFTYGDNIRKLAEDFDYIIIDTPPTLTLRLECAVAAADIVFTPIVPEEQVILGFTSFAVKYDTLRQRFNPSLPLRPYVFFNMINGNDKDHAPNIEKFSKIYDKNFFLEGGLKRRSMVPKSCKQEMAVWNYSNDKAVNAEFSVLMNSMYKLLKGLES